MGGDLTDVDENHHEQDNDNDNTESQNLPCPGDVEHLDWLQQIDTFAFVAGNQVASCGAKLIRRSEIKAVFWHEMRFPTRETSNLAFGIFDRYGRLAPDYYEHEVRKGTGIWGEELSSGDILLFERLVVDAQWRRRGIGSKIVKWILETARSKSQKFFAITRPGHIGVLEGNKKERAERIEANTKAAERFWRSLGFRRIGISSWLAFTDDATHPSKSLDISQDHNRPEISIEEVIPHKMAAVMRTLMDNQATGLECLTKVKETFPNIRRGVSQWPSLLSTDRKGNNILHFAAVGRRTQAVAYLASKWPQLANMRNSQGYTPVEALKANMELLRTWRGDGWSTAVKSDTFRGFTQSEIDCLGVLTGTDVFNLANLSIYEIKSTFATTNDEICKVGRGRQVLNALQFKFGCTCGKCIGGLLSPRMVLALAAQAWCMSEIWGKDIEHNNGERLSSDYDVRVFLQPSTRMHLENNEVARKGYVSMCENFYRCLRERRLPTEDNISEVSFRGPMEEPSAMRVYFSCDGTISAVARTIFLKAFDDDDWAGDGTHARMFPRRIEVLPTCRNDHEFGFVCHMLGYPIHR